MTGLPYTRWPLTHLKRELWPLGAIWQTRSGNGERLLRRRTECTITSHPIGTFQCGNLWAPRCRGTDNYQKLNRSSEKTCPRIHPIRALYLDLIRRWKRRVEKLMQITFANCLIWFGKVTRTNCV